MLNCRIHKGSGTIAAGDCDPQSAWGADLQSPAGRVSRWPCALGCGSFANLCDTASTASTFWLLLAKGGRWPGFLGGGANQAIAGFWITRSDDRIPDLETMPWLHVCWVTNASTAVTSG